MVSRGCLKLSTGRRVENALIIGIVNPRPKPPPRGGRRKVAVQLDSPADLSKQQSRVVPQFSRVNEEDDYSCVTCGSDSTCRVCSHFVEEIPAAAPLVNTWIEDSEDSWTVFDNAIRNIRRVVSRSVVSSPGVTFIDLT